VPLSFNDVDREDYTSAIIAIYEMQNIQPLLDLYVFSYMRTCASYDSTVKSLGYDETRVRYRQQRRTLVREIILGLMTGDPMKKYVGDQAQKLIKPEEQLLFIEDVMEDLRDIDMSRLAGLGVTPDQLRDWENITQKESGSGSQSSHE